jgi:hypothetical protein
MFEMAMSDDTQKQTIQACSVGLAAIVGGAIFLYSAAAGLKGFYGSPLGENCAGVEVSCYITGMVAFIGLSGLFGLLGLSGAVCSYWVLCPARD